MDGGERCGAVLRGRIHEVRLAPAGGVEEVEKVKRESRRPSSPVTTPIHFSTFDLRLFGFYAGGCVKRTLKGILAAGVLLLWLPRVSAQVAHQHHPPDSNNEYIRALEDPGREA